MKTLYMRDMRRGRRSLATLTTAALVTILLAACGQGSSAGTAADDTISFASAQAVGSMDPDKLKTAQDSLYTNQVYDRLVYLDSELNPQPMLATKWAYDPKRGTLDFHLREGVKFHDGTDFDAKAVKANIERSQNVEGSTTAADLEIVKSVEVLDPYRVRLNLARGGSQLTRVLGGPAGSMISPDAMDSPHLDVEPVGAGPWIVKSVKSEVVTYEAFDEYWDPAVQVTKNLELLVMPDEDARLNALRSGDLDISYVRADGVDSAESAGLTVKTVPAVNQYMILLNTQHGPLADVRVRRALQMATDKDAIARDLLMGRCQTTAQLFHEGSFAYSAELDARQQFDLDQAKGFLAQAGYPEGFTLKMATYSVPFFTSISEVVQAQWKELGVQVELVPVEIPEVRERFALDKSVDATFHAMPSRPDPGILVADYLLPTSPWNPGGTAPKGLSDLALSASTKSVDEERAALYREISEIAIDNASYISLCRADSNYVMQSNVNGFDGGSAAVAVEFRGVSEE